jgi:hypothetical protein
LEPSEALAAPIDAAEATLPTTQPTELDPKSEVEVTAERVAEEDAELQKIEATTTSNEAHQVRCSSSSSRLCTLTHAQIALDQSAEVDDEDDAESDTSEFEIITGDEDKTAANPWGETVEEDEEAQQGGLDPNWAGYNGQNQMGGQGYDMQGVASNFGMYPNTSANDMMQYMMQQMGMSQQMMSEFVGTLRIHESP